MTLQFCPQCSTPLVIAPVHGRDRESCPACDYVAFHKPAPVVLAIIEHAERLVLIRRKLAPLAGYWAPPGGYVELGESLEDAVVREAREETALEVAVDGLLGVYSQAGVRAMILAYRAHSTGGEPAPGDDAGELCLVAPGQLPMQRPPTGGEPLDHWFFAVIRDVTTPWQWGRRPSTRTMTGR
ncbi:NUDIX hydrolase [Aromatoleum buckelii]|uniref:NUDIX domain-containing protein n=1 Tax=Aromatoleum buckelii TaxID=200254 RepID=A0ABX1N363_9RHOO|nr:NUDIX domain-containing protein [Aromatoleum buckelii]MCK0513178.1 NUDIX domain-containing protein [Aromatoleum buckelii]